MNTGALYPFIAKPVDPPRLEAILKRELGFYMAQREARSGSEQRLPCRNRITANDVLRFALRAGGLSQRFRNSASAIEAFLSLAHPPREKDQDVPKSEVDFGPWKDLLQQTRHRLEEVQSLLQDLWSPSEQAVSELTEYTHLRNVVGEVVTELEGDLASKNIRVRNKVSRFLPAMEVDRPKLRRFLDLFLRAQVATLPAGSRVTLSANSPVCPRTVAGGIEVQLIDDGPRRGILTNSGMMWGGEIQSCMLGCYLIAYHLGGQIAGEAQAKGTIYTVRLPVVPNGTDSCRGEPALLQEIGLPTRERSAQFKQSEA